MDAKTEASRKTSWRDAMAVYLQPRVLIILFLGFSSGLPLALSGSTLQIWMKESGVDLRTIGLFVLVGTPYTLKFLWAPLVDALHVPFLTRALGRRRGWLVFSQLLLIAAIMLLALTDPAVSPFYVALGALLVAAMSATQDIVVDAFRVESLPENEQAAGMASYVAAYRIGLLVSTAGALFLVSAFEDTGLVRSSAWMWGYIAMAGLVLIGTITALVATEPDQSRQAEDAKSSESAFTRVLKAAVGAFSEFLTRKDAWAALAFIVLFKFTDAFSGAMTAPFVIDLGFTKNEYAAIVKGVGLAATLLGGFAGGFLARAYPITTCLWIGGVLQAVANLSFSWLALVGVNQWALAFAITAEEFHQRHLHRDLRRISVVPVQKPAAHGDAIRATHRPRRSRADLFFFRCGICRGSHRLADILRHLHAGRDSEPHLARVAAAARTFRDPGPA